MPPKAPADNFPEFQLLNLDQGALYSVRRPRFGAMRTETSPLAPPTPLATPRLALPARGRIFFLEADAKGARFTSYVYDAGLRCLKPESKVTGPLTQPGGELHVLSSPSLPDCEFVLWGTQAPFLMGISTTSEGGLAPAGQLPALTQAPAAVALGNNGCCVGMTDGSIQVYRLKEKAPAQLLTTLPAAGPIRALTMNESGLWALRSSPARLDCYPIDLLASPSQPPVASSVPMPGTPLSMAEMGPSSVITTTQAPQVVSVFSVQDGHLVRTDEIAAIRGNFSLPTPLPKASPTQHFRGMLLFDGASGQGCFLGHQLTLEHFTLPAGRYAPVQLVWEPPFN